jgi:hypothetical protein
MDRADEPDTDDGAAHVVVQVVRSGGMAGLSRRWRVESAPADAPRWVALIERCPWDAAASPATGADRFVWHITASISDDAPVREARVPDARLDGAWRALVDGVRDAST